ncbi:hypothetical protein J4437_01605 [Candidatus Woesearchaeota archaeon]|nr:hypothetical protein [Candidatus Woesearchaeota archaeon]
MGAVAYYTPVAGTIKDAGSLLGNIPRKYLKSTAKTLALVAKETQDARSVRRLSKLVSLYDSELDVVLEKIEMKTHNHPEAIQDLMDALGEQTVRSLAKDEELFPSIVNVAYYTESVSATKKLAEFSRQLSKTRKSVMGHLEQIAVYTLDGAIIEKILDFPFKGKPFDKVLEHLANIAYHTKNKEYVIEVVRALSTEKTDEAVTIAVAGEAMAKRSSNLEDFIRLLELPERYNYDLRRVTNILHGVRNAYVRELTSQGSTPEVLVNYAKKLYNDNSFLKGKEKTIDKLTTTAQQLFMESIGRVAVNKKYSLSLLPRLVTAFSEGTETFPGRIVAWAEQQTRMTFLDKNLWNGIPEFVADVLHLEDVYKEKTEAAYHTLEQVIKSKRQDGLTHEVKIFCNGPFLKQLQEYAAEERPRLVLNQIIPNGTININDRFSCDGNFTGNLNAKEYLEGLTSRIHEGIFRHGWVSGYMGKLHYSSFLPTEHEDNKIKKSFLALQEKVKSGEREFPYAVNLNCDEAMLALIDTNFLFENNPDVIPVRSFQLEGYRTTLPQAVHIFNDEFIQKGLANYSGEGLATVTKALAANPPTTEISIRRAAKVLNHKLIQQMVDAYSLQILSHFMGGAVYLSSLQITKEEDWDKYLTKVVNSYHQKIVHGLIKVYGEEKAASIIGFSLSPPEMSMCPELDLGSIRSYFKPDIRKIISNISSSEFPEALKQSVLGGHISNPLALNYLKIVADYGLQAEPAKRMFDNLSNLLSGSLSYCDFLKNTAEVN